MTQNEQATNSRNTAPKQSSLEDGCPVYLFDEPGQQINVADMFAALPTATGIAKLLDGRSVVFNSRAAVALDVPNENGTFTKTPNTVGMKLGEDGTLLSIGEDWIGSGSPIEKVIVESGNAYKPTWPAEGEATPGLNMVDSARSILQDFERSQLAGPQ